MFSFKGFWQHGIKPHAGAAVVVILVVGAVLLPVVLVVRGLLKKVPGADKVLDAVPGPKA